MLRHLKFKNYLSGIFGVFIACSTGMVLAGSDDFCEIDFNRLLKGHKNMENAKLEDANLSGRDLSNVDFEEADLENVNFQNANLSNANFEKADLSNANFKGANIEGANFKGAELEFTTWIDGRVCAEGSIGSCW